MEKNTGSRLVIARRDDSGQWVIDEDSLYILDESGDRMVVLRTPLGQPETNKWSITLSPLPMSLKVGEEIILAGGTFIVDKVELNGVAIRCTGVALTMLPKAPVSLHLDIMPRDLEIITE